MTMPWRLYGCDCHGVVFIVFPLRVRAREGEVGGRVDVHVVQGNRGKDDGGPGLCVCALGEVAR